MANPISTKLKIKAGAALLTLNAPKEFEAALGKLPENVSIGPLLTMYNQVHWFVLNKTQLEKELSKVMKGLKEGMVVWVYYPKGSSKLQTDLTRDKGWDCLLSEGDKLTWINLISFNETWSVFGFRPKTTTDTKKAAAKKPREIFKWVDPVTKEVKLPAELAAAFKKYKNAANFFHQLSFTNKKEYIEWIVTAKQAATKTERIKGTIDRLQKEWKNPRNL